jgi:hypothetical protein
MDPKKFKSVCARIFGQDHAFFLGLHDGEGSKYMLATLTTLTSLLKIVTLATLGSLAALSALAISLLATIATVDTLATLSTHATRSTLDARFCQRTARSPAMPPAPPPIPPLPEGCALGLPIPLGEPAVEAPPNPVMSLVAHGNAHGILELGRRGLYEGMRREVTTLTDRIDGGSGQVTMRILEATPLHLAVQLGAPDVVAALIVLDPSLIHSTVRLFFENGRRQSSRLSSMKPISVAEMAHMYSQRKGDRHEVVLDLIRSWQPLIEDGFFSGDPSIHSRLKVFGFTSELVVNNMVSLAKDEWLRVIFSLVEEDAYHLILRVGTFSNVGFCWEQFTVISLIAMPVQLIPIFNFREDGERIVMCGMNPLHKALVLGKYEAACALVLVCPKLVLGHVQLRDSVDSDRYFKASPSMLVKLFNNERSDQDRQMCFRIMHMAEKDASLFEPLGLPTLAERIAAAGDDPRTLLSRWGAVASTVPCPRLWKARLDRKRVRDLDEV